MNTTTIEWVRNPDGTPGATWSPITGCLFHDAEGNCKGGTFPCYAYRLANTRLRHVYVKGGIPASPMPRHDDNPFYPRFWPEKLTERLGSWRAPKGIFVCDMGDLFGQGVPHVWTQDIVQVIDFWHLHRFYLLTKQAQNLVRWSPFPDNAWVGVTVTRSDYLIPACDALHEVQATIKYISFEPLLEAMTLRQGALSAMLQYAGVSWVIIGAQTRPTVQPEVAWVREIVKAGAAVFLKSSLLDMRYQVCDGPNFALRQEMPEGGKP